eukprot:CAMPEP_0206491530 /NCGR_PEP_ID=MMETSP0324_2-20121206/45101_1 /ASSEMBLY_ACC=CAM_ASM_000836 /TAXON_ID=2866 /ORGANISM="Crypthecodinium cohnii, Strain Seligo" /LENGTH=348 /DNA_ID=CAMNT_0053972839 /DNA_START=202 /DNA_END=1245 /DNA_ORIENTATION=-
MASAGYLVSVYPAQGDPTRPSFFEILAPDQIMDLLRPALQFIVGSYAEQAPPRLLPLLANWNTIQDAFFLMLDTYHLRYNQATFAENLFGLCRQEEAPDKKLTALQMVELQAKRSKSPQLALRQQLGSLLFAALLPRLRALLARRYREAEATPEARRTPLQRQIVRFYPALHTAVHTLSVTYKIGYLLGQTKRWSPSLHILGLELVRQQPAPPSPPEALSSRTARERICDGLSTVGSGLAWGLTYSLQFGQWWFQRSHLLQPYQPRKVPPPPPPMPPYRDVSLLKPQPGKSTEDAPGSALVLLPQDRTICAICHRRRKNPAASSSGFVFCYPCLVKHVSHFGHCPVTG